MLGVIHSLTPRTANHYTIKTYKRQVNFRYFFLAAGISLVLAEKARKSAFFFPRMARIGLLCKYAQLVTVFSPRILHMVGGVEFAKISIAA